MRVSLRRKNPGLSTTRIEAFSDGVFAIAITLLILSIAIPELSTKELSEGKMLESIISLWPKFLSFFISFVIIGIYWIGHVIMFRFIKKSDRILLTINILLLMFISFIPFSAALLGQYGSDRYAVMLYGTILVLEGLMYILLWTYAMFAKLVGPNIDPEMIKKGYLILILAPLAYAVSVLIALINPTITLIIYAVIPIFYLLPGPVDDFVSYAFEEEQG